MQGTPRPRAPSPTGERAEGLGRAAARLQADLAAAHSELEAERQGRAAQTGAFRAQLDEIRAAKEEACRDAVEWAEGIIQVQGRGHHYSRSVRNSEEDKGGNDESESRGRMMARPRRRAPRDG